MKLDQKVTLAIQEWLETPAADRDIMAGAELLLSLNRNRALYNSVVRRPEKLAAKVEYELRKFLRMRLDNMTVADVVRMEEKLMPRVRQTLDPTLLISPDSGQPEACVARGRRTDHDSLPPEIQQLWDSNLDRIHRIDILFNELKAMHDAQPCDRYDKLVILDKLDTQYRRNLELYDSYVPAATGDPEHETADSSVSDDTEVSDSSKVVNNARKTLSKYRKQLSELSDDDPRRTAALEKIRQAVDAIIASGAGVAPDTREELSALGINFE